MFNNIINKIGTDKILHFLVGAVITFTINVLAIFQEGVIDNVSIGLSVIGVIIATTAAVFKEYIIDKQADKKDIIATLIGAIFAFIVCAVGVWFCILSN